MKTKLTGWDLLNNPRLNKGTAFPENERDTFFLHGLLPPHIGALEDQRERRQKGLVDQPSPFHKYAFMRNLQDTNETLFYSLIIHNVEASLPIVYTPTVGEGCQRFSEIWQRNSRGAVRQLSQQASHRPDLRPPPLRRRALYRPRADGLRILGLWGSARAGWGFPSARWKRFAAAGRDPPRMVLADSARCRHRQ